MQHPSPIAAVLNFAPSTSDGGLSEGDSDMHVCA